jgi:ATP-dependent DNA helicase RecG
MRDSMKEKGLTPPGFNTDGMFTVTFRRPFDFEMWVNKWVNNLSQKQIIILKAIHQNQDVKKSALQQLTDFSASAIDKNLETLKKESLLEREGTKGWCMDFALYLSKSG